MYTDPKRIMRSNGEGRTQVTKRRGKKNIVGEKEKISKERIYIIIPVADNNVRIHE